jgi:hypothetical protein
MARAWTLGEISMSEFRVAGHAMAAARAIAVALTTVDRTTLISTLRWRLSINGKSQTPIVQMCATSRGRR